MSDSVQPHPWDSPGKNTGVGCHFLLQCIKVKVNHSVMSDSSRPHRLQPTSLLRPWDFPGKSTGVGCHCLLCGNPEMQPLPEEDLVKEVQTHSFPPLPPPRGSPGGIRAGQNLELRLTSFARSFRNEGRKCSGVGWG